MATITVSARGQMVIPAKLREKFGIKPHSKIECVDMGKGVALIPITGDPVKSGKGILKGAGVTTNFLLQLKKEDLNLEHKTSTKARALKDESASPPERFASCGKRSHPTQ